MKKLMSLVIAVIMVMSMLMATGCNKKSKEDNSLLSTAKIGIEVGENNIVFVKHTFTVKGRLEAVRIASLNREFLKSRGEIVTSIKVKEDETWNGWYNAYFESTMITIAE